MVPLRAGLQAAAWALVLLALALGYRGAQVKADPLRVGDDVVLAVDFHVHSFPGDGSLPPWDLAREAARRGLDAIALTNHNHRLSWTVAQLVPWPIDGALLIPGEELTAVGYHMAAVGASANVSWRQSASAAAGQIRQLGGIAIAAHPAGPRANVVYDRAALIALDGVEAAHPLMLVWPEGRRDLQAFYARAAAQHPTIAAIGSTDFHFFAPIGLCRTYVFARERSVAGILDAVRRGRTVACDATGQTYGPTELRAAVTDSCRGAGFTPPRTASWRDTASAVVLWMGLFALVIGGVRERALQ